MIKIHKIEQGPIHKSEVPPDFISQDFIESGAEFFVEISTEADGEYPIPASVWFKELDQAYKFVNYFKTHLGPLIDTEEGFKDVNGNLIDLEPIKNRSN